MRHPLLALGGLLPGLAFAQGSFQPVPIELEGVIALSHDGSIVLGFEADDSDPSYTFFTPILMDGTGALTWLDIPPGFDSGFPSAMSADGQTIVGGVNNSSSGNQASVRWDASGTASILESGASVSFVRSISGNGAFALGVNDFKAARWAPNGALERLSDFPAVVQSTAYASSFDGSVIAGDWSNAIGVRRPFVWADGSGMTSLPVPAGFTFSSARFVSADGLTIHGTASKPSPLRAVVWRWTATDGLTILLAQAGDTGLQNAFGANASGTRLVGSDTSVSPPVSSDTVWDAARPTLNFLEFLAARQIPPLPNITRYSPEIISGDGHVFSGRYFDPVLGSRPWIASDGWRPGIQSTTCVHGVLNQSGRVSRLMIDGLPFAPANEVTLRAEDLPPGAFTLFVASQTSAPPTTPPGSIGTLCLGGAIGRYARAGEIRAADAAGAATLNLDLTMTPTPSGTTSVLAGQTWHYQGWHRDIAQGQATANFTNAVNLTYQ